MKYKRRNRSYCQDSRPEVKPLKKLKLYGFNNLTKTLSFNMYDVCYTRNIKNRDDYIQYIDEEYNAERLTAILTQVSNIIGSNILNIAKQDYDPQGASVTMLISENKTMFDELLSRQENPQLVAHLDKSHITVHTYPESHPDSRISTFRADIDVSTCGVISPLRALNFLINSFYSDIVNIDYRVRGFTRDVSGKKYFIDHKINSIQNYLSPEILKWYHIVDINVYQENVFHTKMMLRDFDTDEYIFGSGKKNLKAVEKQRVRQKLEREMSEIFYGENVPSI
jgi:S-adenosylmethionine decarboxylase